MSQNLCSPQNVYGPYQQTLFLGCSVLSFTANAGWNEQASEVTVELVEDPCSNPKTFFPTQAGNFVPTVMSGPDPGFTDPNIGAPAYFRVADFEFAGIIQSYTRKDGADGNPVFSVKLTDPRVILEHTQLILDHYEGSVKGMHNLLNVYGFLESIEADCPLYAAEPDVGFGAPAGGFGFSNRTEEGIPWNLVKGAVQVLAGNQGGSPNVNYGLGGVSGRGGSLNGYGEIWTGPNGYATYIIDITELPFSVTNALNYRISGPTKSLMELISEVCADSGCDYYVELLPTAQALVIKVRIIARTNQPAIGTIQAHILSHSVATGGYGVVTDSIGRELRNEVNNKFLIGGKQQSVYEATGNAWTGIIPFWGYDSEGVLTQSFQRTGCPDPDPAIPGTCNWRGPLDWNIKFDFRFINPQLATPVDITYGADANEMAWVWEGEIRAALGDFTTFDSFMCTQTVCQEARNMVDGLGNNIYPQSTLARWYRAMGCINDPRSFAFNAPSTGPFSALNLPAGNPMGGAWQLGLLDRKTLYTWLNGYAKDFYGKKWLVPIPFVCYDVDPGAPKLMWSDMPSTEGGWNEGASVLGLGNPTPASEFFKTEDGRFEPILRWEETAPGHWDGCDPPMTGVNAQSLSPDDYVTNIDLNGGFLWQKATIHDEWITGLPLTSKHRHKAPGNQAYALLTVNNPVLTGSLVPETLATPGIVSVVSGQPDRVAAGWNNIGNALGALKGGLQSYRMIRPLAAAAPVRSNTQTYGPWYASAVTPGLVNAESDDGLVPWEYGGLTYLESAGLSRVAQAVTAMQYGERGQVTIPGYPTVGLGAALNSSIVLYPFRVLSAGAWNGYPYNYVTLGSTPTAASVSNINVTVSPQGVTTDFTVTTFSPVFGRFSKNNAQRLKRIGKLNANFLRSRNQQRGHRQFFDTYRQYTRGKGNPYDLGGNASPRSPGVLLAGKIVGDEGRKIVLVADQNTLAYYDDYDNTSLMSFDGLLRPVSKTGGGPRADLPTMKSGTGNYCTGIISHHNRHLSQAPPAPVSGMDQLIIAANYLDPLADPVSNTNLSTSYRATGTFNAGANVRITGSGGCFVGYSGSGYSLPLGWTSVSGHDWESVARSTLAGLSGLNKPSDMSGTYSMLISGLPTSYTKDYRFLALRGPLVMQGWGYDVFGKPIPNARGWAGDGTSGEPVADSGNTHAADYSGLTDRFAPDWLKDSKHWPVAPVDLRYDRQREVWTVPPPFRMYQVQIGGEMVGGDVGAGSTGLASVLNASDLFDKDGNPAPLPSWTTCAITGSGTGTSGTGSMCFGTGLTCHTGQYPVITLNNWTDSALTSGSKAVVYYDTDSCQYWPIVGGGGGGTGTGEYDYWMLRAPSGNISGTGYWYEHEVYNHHSVSFSGCEGTTIEVLHPATGSQDHVVKICASPSTVGYSGHVGFVNGIYCSGSTLSATTGDMFFEYGLLKTVT